MQINPIEQFEIHNLKPLFSVGSHELYFTNSAVLMLIIVAVVSAAFDRRARRGAR